ncbi:MAG: hypothetical protein JSR39_09685, partial [Verrucomicrobia bacterium]|nr:hypothetical protein [Verrucomicrobiota bacterium]
MTLRFFQVLALTSFSISAMAEYDEDLYFDEDSYLSDDLDQVALVDSSDAPSFDQKSDAQLANFASARPNLSKGAGLILSGDFLYWQAEEGGLSYGLQSENHTILPLLRRSTPFQGVDGKVSRIQPEYEPGYRLSMAYQLPYDQWDLSLSWARYQSSSHDHISQKADQVVFPYWLSLNFAPLAQNAKANWTLNYNTLDFDLGRMFYLGRDFSIKPTLGFKAAWIEQTLTVLYGNVVFSTNNATPNVRSKNRCTFQGYGVDLGLDGNWKLGAGFELFGSCNAALLWGNFDLAIFEKNIGLGPRSKLTNNVQKVVPELGFSAGVGWEKSFFSDRMFLNVHVSWEEQ